MTSLKSFQLDKAVFNPALYSRIYKAWFGGLPDGASSAPDELSKRWFGFGATDEEKKALDDEFKREFEGALDAIGPSKLTLPTFVDLESDRKQYEDFAKPFTSEFKTLETSDNEAARAGPEVALVLIILLDQISRNVFRTEQARIFNHYDRISQAILHVVRQQKLDRHKMFDLQPPKWLWFYMPLMHSESIEDHETLVQILTELKAGLVGEEYKDGAQYVDRGIYFSGLHRAILEKFGRYPHRNRFLGRLTTEEEQAWLDAGGERFGT